MEPLIEDAAPAERRRRDRAPWHLAWRARRSADVSSSEFWLRGLLGLAVVLPLVLYSAMGWYLHQRIHSEALKRLERVVVASQEHMAKVLDTNAMMLGRVQDLVGGWQDATLQRESAALHARLKSITAEVPQVGSLWVVDAQGRPLATDRFPVPEGGVALDLSDRDYFVAHREGRGGAFFISEPGVGRLTKFHFINTSIRREVHGQFAGTVHASLDRDYFVQFYAALAAEEPTLTIALFRSDGVLLVRHPALDEGSFLMPAGNELLGRFAAGERQGSGMIVSSSFDQIERLIAFRSVEPYPVYVTAGVETGYLMALWRREMLLLATLMLPISTALVIAAWIALRRARRERDALSQVRIEAEQRLRVEGALLKTQKLQALGQITGSVAHDFNNLLAVVSNSAHLILRRPAGTDSKPQAAAIERAVRNGVHLTRQLLAFSRRKALRPERVDLADTLPRTAELLRTSVSGRVQVELSVEPGTAAVCIDPADLELALLNLVLNARDAMPQGGVVKVHVRNRTGEGQSWVEITVADNGTGIGDDVRKRIFEPFFTTKAEVNGTGLGLYQVRTACEHAGGSVAVESTPGEGTTMRLTLPAMEGPSMPEAFDAEDPNLSCSVLLVEDDLQVGATTAALLLSLGARVERVTSAAQALAHLDAAAEAPDVILSDVAMPGEMNGLALAQHLRRVRPTLGIVLMTGFTAEFDIAIADGFPVLSKPFEPRRLAIVVVQACREAEARKSFSPEPARA